MKLALFGASGRSGLHVLEQALAAGHSVTALARTPDKLAHLTSDHLQVVAGDIQDTSAVAQTTSGAEAVISLLGPTENKPVYAVSAGTQHIITSMQAAGIRRLVVTSGAGVSDPHDTPTLPHKFIGLLVRVLAKWVHADMVRTVEMVRDSGLDWTVVRVPMLVDGPRTDTLRVGYVNAELGRSISRANLAAFVLAQVDDGSYIGQAPAICDV